MSFPPFPFGLHVFVVLVVVVVAVIYIYTINATVGLEGWRTAKGRGTQNIKNTEKAIRKKKINSQRPLSTSLSLSLCVYVYKKNL